MAKINALASFISLMHGDRASTLDAATSAFTEDFGHFARSNNREPLNVAIAGLKKAPKDKAIASAITEAYKASGLAVGYIGAQSGKFTAQTVEVQTSFNDAIYRASEAFRASLETSEAFAEKAERTKEEKEKAKGEKAEKAEKATAELINAKVQAGELIRASDVKTLTDFSALALAEALTGFNAVSAEALAVLLALPQVSAQLAEAKAEALALSAQLAEAKAEALALSAQLVEAKAKPVKAKVKAPV